MPQCAVESRPVAADQSRGCVAPCHWSRFEMRCPRGARVKAKVTFRIDADLLREARLLAAEEGRSVSALLSDFLARLVGDRDAFHKARHRALARLRRGLYLR